MNIKKLVITFFIVILIISIEILFSFLTDYYQNYKNSLNSGNKEVQIAFISDREYVNYLKVALKSAIVNKNKDSIYYINIVGINLTDKEIQELKNMEENNIFINIINTDYNYISHIPNYELKKYISSKTELFKFVLPYIINNTDKLLYIDCDTLILGDLLNCYNTNISNKYIAAVLATYSNKIIPIVGNLFWEKNIPQYNCGVLLLNLKKMREDKIPEKLIEAKTFDKDKNTQTQDCFNKVIPINKTVVLSPFYNFLPQYESADYLFKDLKKLYFPKYNNQTIEELYEKAVIIHWFNTEKPWQSNSNSNFDKKWHEYAKMVNVN